VAEVETEEQMGEGAGVEAAGEIPVAEGAAWEAGSEVG